MSGKLIKVNDLNQAQTSYLQVNSRFPFSGRDFIGFAKLPEQIHRKSVKRGFEFTLMVMGESGLGKSTLINSLFLTDLYKNRVMPSVEERIDKTTKIEKKTLDIEEKGVKLRLSIVDTPGFGDAINCEDSWKVCTAYIEEQVNRLTFNFIYCH